MRNYETLSWKEQLPFRLQEAVIDLFLGFVSTLYLYNILVNSDIDPSELDTTTAVTAWITYRFERAFLNLLFVVFHLALNPFARCMTVISIPFALPAIAIVGKLSKICRYVRGLLLTALTRVHQSRGVSRIQQ